MIQKFLGALALLVISITSSTQVWACWPFEAENEYIQEPQIRVQIGGRHWYVARDASGLTQAYNMLGIRYARATIFDFIREDGFGTGACYEGEEYDIRQIIEGLFVDQDNGSPVIELKKLTKKRNGTFQVEVTVTEYHSVYTTTLFFPPCQ